MDPMAEPAARRRKARPVTDEDLRLRVNVLDPPKDVRFRVQRGRSDLLPPARESRNTLCFEFAVKVGTRPTGEPNFLGPFAQGPPDARFVYVNSGTLAGQPESCWSRRAKIPLTGISWALVDAARREDAVIETDMPGGGHDGSPTCATVKGISWRVRPGRSTHD